MKNKKDLKREIFLEKYSEFNNWLSSIGFKTGSYGKSTVEDYHYSHYNNYIDDLYSVEHYHNDVLDISIRFMRDRNEHKFMLVGGIFGSYSETYNIKEFKKLISENLKTIKKEKIDKLNSLIVLD